MDERGAAALVAGQGLVGNANQKGRRQVTLIEEERWADAMDDLAAALAPSTRRHIAITYIWDPFVNSTRAREVQ